MREVPDESIQLIVTSPPYWQLKDYGSGDQIGYNDSYEAYINHLNLVWHECYRVLQPGCRLCINIGDQFSRSVYYGRYKIIPIRTEIIKFCETNGFDYMGAIIWQKVTTTNTTGGATIMGSFPYPRNGILKLDYEFILLFKKIGKSPKVPDEIKAQSAMTTEEWNQYFSGHWTFPGEKQRKHLAMFPEELPRRLIRMFAFVGETVLDPFLGSGTTSMAAINLGRNSVGYEINQEFLPIIEEKLGWHQQSMFTDAAIDIIRQERRNADYEKEWDKLPYIFRDPVQFDKKADPKKLNFGSKVDATPTDTGRFFSVKAVISPEEVLLSSGKTIRLLGIKTKAETADAAIQFLTEKTRSQKVFLKYESPADAPQDRALCYLYLKNKTFLNAHLIKNGLVDVDTEREYKLKQKFIKLKAGKK
ncbi:site-specific DNA-methyltransferase [candidate division KSB1 bacterium]|nr:site-specific DNA-methyltransferase [candidate division KSB1 bacterium]